MCASQTTRLANRPDRIVAFCAAAIGRLVCHAKIPPRVNLKHVVLFGYHKLSLIIASAAIGTVTKEYTNNILIHPYIALGGGAPAGRPAEGDSGDGRCPPPRSELMKAKLKTGSTIVSFVWGCSRGPRC